MADVFISYVSDDRALAAALARALESSGYSVWWDRNLHGGADFAAEIERELSAARAVIVLWSAKSRDSPWVRDEAAYARDAGKLVPVRLDDVASPLGFRQLQTVDLIGWNGDGQDVAYTGLLASLRHFVATPAAARSPTTAAPAPRRSTRTLAIGAAALLVALAIGFAWLWRQPSVPPPVPAQDPANWTVEVRPFTTPTDGSLDAITGIAMNELVLALAARGLTIQREPAPGATIVARHRLEGAVQRTGDSISLTLQLVAATSGGIIWTDAFPLAAGTPSFERVRQAAVLIDSTLATRAWGGALATRSEIARGDFIAAVREVYRLWYTADGNWLVAVRHAENALRADPGIREAHLWLEVLYANRLGYSIRAAEALPIALWHAQRVLELEPNDTFPLGQTNVLLELDYAAAVKNLEHGREFADDSTVDVLIGNALLAQGRLQDALARLQAGAARRESFDGVPAAIALARALTLAGRHGEARRALDRALSMTDDASLFGLQALLVKTLACHADGDLAGANDALDRAWRAHGAARPEWFPGALALVGRTDDARRILAAAETRFAASPLAYSTGAFQGAFRLGDFDHAFVWLERAIDNREIALIGEVRLAPAYAPLRADPRFATAMARLEAIEKPSPR